MLEQTFCHLPGIGSARETALWHEGCTSWAALKERSLSRRSGARDAQFRSALDASIRAFEDRRPGWFGERLPSSERWRLFPEFHTTAGYLDIETNATGTMVTAVALSDGHSVASYVRGKNLHALAGDLQAFDLLVTYNGTCFDLPVLRSVEGIEFQGAHIDLRFALRRIGVRGGLKRAEHAFGLGRGMLEGIDGFAAVLLWNEYATSGDGRVLETLLAYNVEDVRSLPLLMTACSNHRVAQTPFAGRYTLEVPALQPNPYRPDPTIVENVLARLAARSPWQAGFHERSFA